MRRVCLKELRQYFVDYAYKFVNIISMEQKHARPKPNRSAEQAFTPAKTSRAEPLLRPLLWDDACTQARINLQGDSLIVINWINARWRVKYKACAVVVRHVWNVLFSWMSTSEVLPPRRGSDYARHVRRKFNTHADALAGTYVGGCCVHVPMPNGPRGGLWQVEFDGSYTEDTRTGCSAAIVKLFPTPQGNGITVLEIAVPMRLESALQAELAAATLAVFGFRCLTKRCDPSRALELVGTDFSRFVEWVRAHL